MHTILVQEASSILPLDSTENLNLGVCSYYFAVSKLVDVPIRIFSVVFLEEKKYVIVMKI